MPTIHQEVIEVKLYKLVKNHDQAEPIINEELLTALSSVVEELAGQGVVVEIGKQ